MMLKIPPHSQKVFLQNFYSCMCFYLSSKQLIAIGNYNLYFKVFLFFQSFNIIIGNTLSYFTIFH